MIILRGCIILYTCGRTARCMISDYSTSPPVVFLTSVQESERLDMQHATSQHLQPKEALDQLKVQQQGVRGPRREKKCALSTNFRITGLQLLLVNRVRGATQQNVWEQDPSNILCTYLIKYGHLQQLSTPAIGLSDRKALC